MLPDVTPLPPPFEDPSNFFPPPPLPILRSIEGCPIPKINAFSFPSPSSRKSFLGSFLSGQGFPQRRPFMSTCRDYNLFCIGLLCAPPSLFRIGSALRSHRFCFCPNSADFTFFEGFRLSESGNPFSFFRFLNPASETLSSLRFPIQLS